MKGKSVKKKASGAGKAAPRKASPRSVPRKGRAGVKPVAKAERRASRPAAAKPAAPSRAGQAKTAAPKVVVKPPAPVARPTRKARRAELEPLRRALAERQRELVQAYNVSKGDSRVGADSGTEDYIDYAVSSYAKEFLLSMTEMDRKQLLLVEEALRRMERGEYGRCQQCGEEISRKRLEIAPWARHCLRCQELEEQGLLPQYPSGVANEELEEEASALEHREAEYGHEPEGEPEEDEAGAEEEEGLEGGPIVPAETDDDEGGQS